MTLASDSRAASSGSAAGPSGHWNQGVLGCMALAARRLGAPDAPEAPRSRPGGLDLASLGEAAAGAGLRLRHVRPGFARLRREALRSGSAVVVRLHNGAALLLNRIEPAGGGTAVLLEDAQAGADVPLLVDRRRFEEAWSGDALILRRTARAADPSMPFGFARIFATAAADRRLVAEIVAGAFALGLLALAPVVFMRLLTTRVLLHRTLGTLEVLCLLMLALVAAETVLGFARRSLADRLVARVDTRLWMDVFARLLALPIEHFEATPSGLTVHRVNLLQKVRGVLLVQLFGVVLDAGVLLVFVPAMLLISAPLTGVVLAVFTLILLWIAAMLPGYRRRAVLAERAEAGRGAFLFQALSGIRTVKSLGLDAKQRAGWLTLTEDATALRLRAADRGNLIASVVMVLERLLVVGSMAGGAWMALRFDDPVSLSTLFAFVLLSQRVVAPLGQVAQLVQGFDEVRTAVEDIGLLVNQPAEEGRGGGGVRSPVVGQIEVSRLRFRYRGASSPALRDVSFTVRPGEMFGIMGRSGSGKTTVTRLLQRLHTDYTGTIRLDGVDLRAYAVDHLRSQLGVVLQDSFLFAGSIRDNIAAARGDASAAEIVRAARLAGAEEFIDKLPRGYDTPIYEGSPNLSGGQRQRIAIARALLGDPRVLILDEATSALDPESEAIVNSHLRAMASGRTTLVISHRLSSLVPCDAIMVLDGGEVQDIGTHHELLARSDIYSGLWARQTMGDPEGASS